MNSELAEFISTGYLYVITALYALLSLALLARHQLTPAREIIIKGLATAERPSERFLKRRSSPWVGISPRGFVAHAKSANEPSVGAIRRVVCNNSASGPSHTPISSKITGQPNGRNRHSHSWLVDRRTECKEA